MGLLVVKPGHFSTIQDRGRTGCREWGVPLSGAFDRDSLDIANGLLGNAPDAAAIEMTLYGGTYEARIPLAIALAGAPMDAKLIDTAGAARSLSIPLCCSMKPGERLQIGGTSLGARLYLAVGGGWQTTVLLGSRSDESRLHPGVILAANPGSTPSRHLRLTAPPNLGTESIRVVAGPDAGRLDDLDRWLDSSFRVSRQCDRMGLRMAGPAARLRAAPEPLSVPVAPGSVQVAGGQMLVLGVASGTMGGYPQVAHVISADLARVGQLREGDCPRFRRVSLREARAFDREKRERMSALIRRLATLAGDS